MEQIQLSLKFKNDSACLAAEPPPPLPHPFEVGLPWEEGRHSHAVSRRVHRCREQLTPSVSFLTTEMERALHGDVPGVSGRLVTPSELEVTACRRQVHYLGTCAEVMHLPRQRVKEFMSFPPKRDTFPLQNLGNSMI